MFESFILLLFIAAFGGMISVLGSYIEYMMGEEDGTSEIY